MISVPLPLQQVSVQGILMGCVSRLAGGVQFGELRVIIEHGKPTRMQITEQRLLKSAPLTEEGPAA